MRFFKKSSDEKNADDARSDFAEVLLREGREELNRADSKASSLLGYSGVAFSVLASSALQGKWNPSNLNNHPATEWIFWAGLIFAAIGLFNIAWVLLPRTKHFGDRSKLAYFGHVVLYREKKGWRKETRAKIDRNGKDVLADAISAASSESFQRTVDQVWVVSHIVDSKYKKIRRCLLCYGFAVALCITAPILNFCLG
ncbi:Pycsar system effector family protein [Actinocorallia lasiicapitis]